MYSDLIFGWILWIWLSSWNFFLNILILFSQSLENVIFSFFKSSLENLPGVVVGLRPPRIPRQIFKRTFKNENITFSSNSENKIKIFRQKFQLLSQIRNIQPKITSLYIWYTRLCHHLCNKLPCYIVIWKSRSKCVFQYSTKKTSFFFRKTPRQPIFFKFRNFRKIG